MGGMHDVNSAKDAQLSSVHPSGTLFLVGTPIGNLEDLSPRAARILAEVDLIAAEDTRQTLKLLNHLGLRKEMISYHEHNRDRVAPRLLERMRQGQNVALVSDAGMPLISDPGEELVILAQHAQVHVRVIPGPSAGLAALAVSGLSTERFVFEGFLPVKGGERRQRLQELQGEERTIILYEAPHRLERTLAELTEVLGQKRRAVLVRELTKIHEEVHPGELASLRDYCATTEVRGECVLVLAGAEPLSPPLETPEAALACYEALLAEGLPRQTALKEAARRSGLGRDRLYNLLLEQSPKEDLG